MIKNWPAAEAWVKLDEGKFTNDPDDPGGPTNFGITIHDYRAYINPNGTAADVARMKFEQAATIYKQRYWDPCKCDLLPSGVDYMVFDTAILQGVMTSTRFLQRVLGVDADGLIGPKTLGALDGKDPRTLLNGIETLRRQRLRLSPKWWKYGKGWTNRVNKAVLRARKLVEADSGTGITIPKTGVPTGSTNLTS